MGNGRVPAPVNEFADPLVVDDGTSARTGSPTPGPVGLDSKSGTPNVPPAALADQIVSFPRQRMGHPVGDGQCFTLVDRSLRNAGAKGAADYGTVVPDAD